MLSYLEVAQILFIADLALLGVMDYKWRFAYSLLLVPCWAATIFAAIQLIGAATLFYAIELSVLTLVLMLAGIMRRSKVGDGDIWLLIGLLWCFAETPLVAVGTVGVAYLISKLWRSPNGLVPFATCLAIALGIVLPAALFFGLYQVY